MEEHTYKAGDIVLYIVKNEMGIVKRLNSEGQPFVWFHTGGTASCSPRDIIKPLHEWQAEQMRHSFFNSYCYESLMERRRRVLEGGDVSDLIDVDNKGRLLDKEKKKEK